MTIRPKILLLVLVAGSIAGSAAVLTLGGGLAVVDVLRLADRHAGMLAMAFCVWALVANCLVLPAGSLSLIAGGAAMGTVLPAAIWFVAQLLTAPLLYRAGVVDRDKGRALMHRYLGAPAARLIARAAEDGIWTTAVLRLTPVLPSAPAALIAAACGIEYRSFLIGSMVAGWVRPLYFASIGATVGALAKIGAAQAALSFETLWPLAVVTACAALLLGFRLQRPKPNVMAAAAAPDG